MRRLLLIAVLLVAAASTLVGGALLWSRPRPVRHTVVSGDTLFVLARDHGVTVSQIQAWNGLDGDRIDVGDVLVIWPGTATDPLPTRAPAAPRPAASAPAPSPRSLPPAKPCLPPPDPSALLADEGVLGSQGLSTAQVKAAMDAFVPATLACMDAEGTLRTEITVGCSGRVTRVEVTDRGGLSGEMVDCVRETLYYAPFPAHDLPEGEVFAYPLTFAGPR